MSTLRGIVLRGGEVRLHHEILRPRVVHHDS